MATTSATQPRRLPTQWSMRGLLVLVGLAAIFFAWLRTEMVKEARRRELTSEAQTSHDIVYYHDAGNFQTRRPSVSMRSQLWVRWLAAAASGNDPVGPLATIELNNGFDLEKAAEAIRLFPEAFNLRITCDKLEPQIVAALASCPQRKDNLIIVSMGDNADQIARACAEYQLPLTDFSLKGKPLSRAGLADAAKIGSLFQLIMEDVDDATVELFRNHPGLASITIRNSPEVGDAAGHVLASCPRLVDVTLDRTSMSVEGLAALKASSITRLAWKNAPLPANWIRALRDRPGPHQLSSITLVHAAITDEHLVELAGFPELVDVRLVNAEISRQGTAALAKRPLNTLALRDCRHAGDLLDDATIEPFAAIADSLTLLDIEGANVTDAGIAPLLLGPNLKSLSLCRTKATANTIDSLSKCPSLAVLKIGGGGFDPSWMVNLGRVPTLKWLALTGPEIDDSVFKTGPPAVKVTTLYKTSVTTNCLANLAKWPSLENAVLLYEPGTMPAFSQEDARNYIRDTGSSITVGEVSKRPTPGATKRLNVEVLEARDELE